MAGSPGHCVNEHPAFAEASKLAKGAFQENMGYSDSWGCASRMGWEWHKLLAQIQVGPLGTMHGRTLTYPCHCQLAHIMQWKLHQHH